MAVSATPSKGDPQVLAQVASLSTTANTTIYQSSNTSTRGVLITSLTVVNSTAAAVTFTMKHKNSAGSFFILCNAISIPADGVPVQVVGRNGLIDNIFLLTGSTADTLTGNAGTASALDINVYGIQYDT